jgi:HEAT repeat protein
MVVGKRGVVLAVCAAGAGSPDADMKRFEAEMKSDLRESLTHDDIRAIMDRLAAMSSDPEPKVRAAAAYALGRSGDASVIDKLTSLMSDTDAGVRYAGVYSLGFVADARALETLRKLAPSPDESVRSAVLMAFADHNPAAGVDLIIRAVDDSSPSVRENAVEALCLVSDARVPDVLARLLRGKDISLRVRAVESLDELASGSVFGVRRTSQLSLDMAERAGKILESAAAGYDIEAIAADYPPAIASGNAKMIAPLILCLVLHGTPEMAADFYWSGNSDLREASIAWSKSDNEIKLPETADTPERPKWPGSSTSAK